MGRKDKLRRERKNKPKKESPAAAAPPPPPPITTPILDVVDTDAFVEKPGVDDCFPKSELYVQAWQSAQEIFIDDDEQAITDMFVRGATEYGCVHSMYEVAAFYTLPDLIGRQIHLTPPWFIEGALRGSSNSVLYLVMEIYPKAKPGSPLDLISYWTKMFTKYARWDVGDADVGKSGKSIQKDITNALGRKCRICSQEDTETLTLRQCMGCSICCYCSEECQLIHHGTHKSICRQIQILNKYHKPYAKDIRDAAMRGETHPRLEKLRLKLGLSRPTEEYRELRQHNIHEGKQINPFEFLTAREDGTVWIGSTPNPIGPPSSDTDTTTTPTIINDVMSIKVGAIKTELKSYGICTDTFIEKSEFVDALQEARNGKDDRKPKSTVE